MRFEGRIKADILEEFFKYIYEFVTEIRLKVSLEKWMTVFVDPSNVSMSMMEIDQWTWEKYYTEEEFEVGLDVLKLADMLPVFRGELVDVIIDTQEGRIKISNDMLTYELSLIVPEAIRKWPRITPQEWLERAEREGARITISIDTLREALKTATQDYILFYAHLPDIVYVYNGSKKYEVEWGKFHIEKDSDSIYPAEYLEKLLKLKTASWLDIYFSTDNPCVIQPDTAFKLSYAIAPRVEDKEVYYPEEIPEAKWELHIEEKDLSVYKDGITVIRPTHLVITDRDVIYFLQREKIMGEWLTVAYVEIPMRVPYYAEGVFEIWEDITDFVKKAKELVISERDDHLYIDERKVGRREEIEIEIPEPPTGYRDVYVDVKDLRLLAKKKRGKLPYIAMFCRTGEYMKLVSFFKGEEKPETISEVFEECPRDFIRVFDITWLSRIIGKYARIYYSLVEGEPIFIRFIKHVKREDYDILTYISYLGEYEKELIEDVEEQLGIEIPPPEVPPPPVTPVPEKPAPPPEVEEAKGFVEETKARLREIFEERNRLVEKYNEWYRRFERGLLDTVASLEEAENELAGLSGEIGKLRSEIADLDKKRLSIKRRLEEAKERWEKETGEKLDIGDLLEELEELGGAMRGQDRDLERFSNSVLDLIEKVKEAKRELVKPPVPPRLEKPASEVEILYTPPNYYLTVKFKVDEKEHSISRIYSKESKLLEAFEKKGETFVVDDLEVFVKWDHFAIYNHPRKWLKELSKDIPRKYGLKFSSLDMSYFYKIDFIDAHYFLDEARVKIEIMEDSEKLNKLWVSFDKRLFLAVESRYKRAEPEVATDEWKQKAIHDAFERMIEEVKPPVAIEEQVSKIEAEISAIYDRIKEIEAEAEKYTLEQVRTALKELTELRPRLRKLISNISELMEKIPEKTDLHEKAYDVWSFGKLAEDRLEKLIERLEELEEKLEVRPPVPPEEELRKLERMIFEDLMNRIARATKKEEIDEALRYAREAELPDYMMTELSRKAKERMEELAVPVKPPVPPVKPPTIEELRADYSRYIAEGKFPVAAMLDYVITRAGKPMTPDIQKAIKTLEEITYEKAKLLPALFR